MILYWLSSDKFLHKKIQSTINIITCSCKVMHSTNTRAISRRCICHSCHSTHHIYLVDYINTIVAWHFKYKSHYLNNQSHLLSSSFPPQASFLALNSTSLLLTHKVSLVSEHALVIPLAVPQFFPPDDDNKLESRSDENPLGDVKVPPSYDFLGLDKRVDKIGVPTLIYLWTRYI